MSIFLNSSSPDPPGKQEYLMETLFKSISQLLIIIPTVDDQCFSCPFQFIPERKRESKQEGNELKLILL
jgi:hypothetical protein